MLAYTYISPGKFEFVDKPKPELQDSRDAIVRITLGSICTSDLHIKHGSVPLVSTILAKRGGVERNALLQPHCLTVEATQVVVVLHTAILRHTLRGVPPVREQIRRRD